LFTALLGWRAVANHLVRLSEDEARQETARVLESVPRQLQSASENDQAQRWIADPIGPHRICAAAIERLIAWPAATPSLRLLADQTATVLAGIMQALNGLALLVADPARSLPHRGSLRLRVPIGCPLSSMAGALSSRSAPLRCSGSSQNGRAAHRQSASLRSSSSCSHRAPIRPMPRG
jgi:hypothetical protein